MAAGPRSVLEVQNVSLYRLSMIFLMIHYLINLLKATVQVSPSREPT